MMKDFFNDHIFLAILVSGGLRWNGKYNGDVEAFIPSTGEVCTHSSLPWMMAQHTQQGLMICGGLADCSICNWDEPCPPHGCDTDPGKVCYTYSESDSWTVSNQLAARRRMPVSWKSSAGVVLFYGSGDFENWAELGM